MEGSVRSAVRRTMSGSSSLVQKPATQARTRDVPSLLRFTVSWCVTGPTSRRLSGMESSGPGPAPLGDDSAGAPRQPSALPVLLLLGLGLLLIPPVVFSVVGLAKGMGLAGTAGAVVAQYGVRRLNLFSVAILSLLPVLLLALLVWILGRFTSMRASRRSLAVGGGAAILLVMTWINFEFWPAFLPERVAPGFPHGLEFVIGPLYFAPVAMLVGVGLAAFLNRGPR